MDLQDGLNVGYLQDQGRSVVRTGKSGGSGEEESGKEHVGMGFVAVESDNDGGISYDSHSAQYLVRFVIAELVASIDGERLIYILRSKDGPELLQLIFK